MSVTERSSAAMASKPAIQDMVDPRYTFDASKLSSLRKKAPWMNDSKWFKNVKLSPPAIMKMMTHCHSGVARGIKKGGNPIEVMGLILGRPDVDKTHSLIVTDVFPLPIEGFETRVIADDQDVINHMITLGERLERTRREKFMGWYHSHPFDLADHSHCYLSTIDVSTQLQWQRAEDPHGNPFLAIVVDPLRSIARKTPEIKAFRAYSPDYKPMTNECPDGNIVHEERTRLENWGSCWASYYELQVEYFMSIRSRDVMKLLTKNFLWISTLGSTPMIDVVEPRQSDLEKVASVAQKLEKLNLSNTSSSVRNGGAESSIRRASSSDGVKTENGQVGKVCQNIVDLATERIQENIVQVAKREIFLP